MKPKSSIFDKPTKIKGYTDMDGNKYKSYLDYRKNSLKKFSELQSNYKRREHVGLEGNGLPSSSYFDPNKK